MKEGLALFCDGGFFALPGTLQRLEVDGETVYQAAGVAPKAEQDRDAKAVVTLLLTSPPLQQHAEIALVQEAYRPANPEEVSAGQPRRYQLVSDHLERTLTDLVFERFVTRHDPRKDETVCSLSFSDYSLVRGTE